MKLNKTFGLFENFLNKNFFIDSRDVREDSVFICIKGLNDDGHKYIKPVLNNYKKTIIICEKKSKYSYIYKKKIFFLNKSFIIVIFFLSAQVILGIFTLIAGLNIYLASMHQITSVLLIFSALNLYYLTAK